MENTNNTKPNIFIISKLKQYKKIILVIIISSILEILYCNILLKTNVNSDDAGIVFYTYLLFTGKAKFNFTYLGILYWAAYLSYCFFGVSVEMFYLAYMIIILLLIYIAVLVSSYKIQNIFHMIGVGFIWFYMFSPHDVTLISSMYHVNVIFCFLLMLICVEKIYVQQLTNKISYSLLFCLLLYSFMPLDAMVYLLVVAPLLCIVVLKHVEYRRSGKIKESNREITVAMGSIMIAGLGTYINRMTNQISDLYSGSGIAFSEWDQIIENFKAYVNGVLSLFDVVFYSKKVFSLETIFCLTKILLLFCALVIMYKEIKKIFRGETYDVLIVYVTFAVLFLSAGYILGNIHVDATSRRYLIAIVFVIPIVLCRKLCTCDLEWIKDKTFRYEIITSMVLMMFINVQLFPDMILHRTLYAPQDSLSEFLIEHGLEYGYAEYWIAGRTSLASGLAVKLATGYYDGWEPYNEWVDDEEAFFNYIVISKSDEDHIISIYGEPIAKYDISQYYVYVFDYDIRSVRYRENLFEL